MAEYHTEYEHRCTPQADQAMNPPHFISLVGELSRELVLEAGSDGAGLIANPVMTEVLGWAQADLVGKRLFDLVDAAAAAEFAGRIGSASPGVPLLWSVAMQSSRGNLVEIDWRVIIQGGRIYAMGRPHQATTGIARQSDEDLALRLESMESISKFGGGIAHEFNNLLQTITASLELVRRMISKGRGAEADPIISSAVASALRAATLNQQWIKLSRRQPAEARSLALNDVIAAIVEMLRSSLPLSTTVETLLGPDAGEIWCDLNQAENVILGMMLTACEAIPRGGLISIMTETKSLSAGEVGALRAGSYARIAINATGAPADASAIQAAFERSVMQRFAARNGGYAALGAAPGAAAMLELYLPAHPSA